LIYDKHGGIAEADSCMFEVHMARLDNLVGFLEFYGAEMTKVKVSYSSSSSLKSLFKTCICKAKDREEAISP
jgi:hypothetical protein